jgi:hypothetical protein
MFAHRPGSGIALSATPADFPLGFLTRRRLRQRGRCAGTDAPKCRLWRHFGAGHDRRRALSGIFHRLGTWPLVQHVAPDTGLGTYLALAHRCGTQGHPHTGARTVAPVSACADLPPAGHTFQALARDAPDRAPQHRTDAHHWGTAVCAHDATCSRRPAWQSCVPLPAGGHIQPIAPDAGHRYRCRIGQANLYATAPDRQIGQFQGLGATLY